MLKDKFNRTIKYLRISLTESCNLHCFYCRPNEDKTTTSCRSYLSPEETLQIVRAFSELGVSHVRLSGGEPLLRKDLCLLVKEISRLSGIKDVSLTTNGILLESFSPKLKNAGLNRLNISLDSLLPEKFKEITNGGDLTKVLKGIDSALAYELTPIKINMVVMRGINDNEVIPIIKFCMKKKIILRLIEFMPLGNSSSDVKKRHIPTREIREKVAQHFSLGKTTFKGPGPAWYEYVKEDGMLIGFISAVSQHFCKTCNRVRLMASGKLHLCLGHENQVDLASLIRKPGISAEELKEHIQSVVWNKPSVHRFDKNGSTANKRIMSAIGG
ncbi:MAG TPA: GTP 3',8-cyclase MoaA [Nitrospinota bacterium]|jgi:cyclic pyranopterin phosphate synthase|nr:GTP 3',8-cyclase MoaA [Nitrospinota bacterium]|tara:strand:- start:730 stop:1713 length:984 start_codon:yes stop_codon:yes gene_type:complete